MTRQVRVVTALTIREVRIRNGKNAFMQLFDLLEALVFIIVHWIIFSYMHRTLLVGDSLLLFITTGIFPVLFFRTMSIRAASAIEAAKSVVAVPLVEALDYSLARVFVEFLSFSLMFMFFFAGIEAFGLSKFAIPYNPIAVVEFALLMPLLALGVGLVNSSLIFVFPLWKFAWSMISRVQIFFSAVFFIPEYMPPAVKNILAYNPMLHFVALFRTGFYPTYPTHLLSKMYILQWTFGALVTGLAAERLLRKRRVNHK
ncbi:ABC transporter permease [Rhizobium sp. CFBP 8752]|nr:ABC transporter permease [Rhizobium sp. CFBP 8752]